jgi:HAD superfamily hydrolase (TIGR01549 family)
VGDGVECGSERRIEQAPTAPPLDRRGYTRAPDVPGEVSAVTLDLWHTLLFVRPDDEERYMTNQVQIAADALARAPLRPGAKRVPEGQLARIFERVYAGAVDAAAEGRTVTPRTQIEKAASEAGRAVEVDQYLDELRSEVGRLPFRRAPGALELLGGLREDGYRVAVISNTIGEPGAFLRPALNAMGFDPFVESYVFSDEHPWTKPDPRLFRAALASIGSVAGSAIHVGDGWSDIEGARRAGYRAGILFTGLQEYGERYRALFASTAQRIPPADHQVTRLEEIGPIVRELLPPDAR